ncbi:hypothetical protein [uncultured Nostoc sp.]|uniref:hypothetical protein n=1 Tax=uncultured Nostoc sp. TaxID=340711 RepID=UPI0035CC5917
MENRLQIQDFQDDELYMELTPEELEELKELKGGWYKKHPIGVPMLPNVVHPKPLTAIALPVLYTTPVFPIGVPIDTQSISIASLKNLGTQLSI